MNILLLASHAVAEYDDIRMFHDLGYDVFCPGGYENPAQSGEGIRPALPQVPYHADLHAKCIEQREKYGDPGRRYVDWAKARLHPDVIDWADVIIAHHYVDPWLTEQWDRIKHKRVIWRTCGQSNPELERIMGGLEGLEVVRYSPAERRFFEPRGSFGGEDAVIRFGKYPADYGPWRGHISAVGNITQDMAQRGDHCGFGYWQAATDGVPHKAAGKGSEAIDGLGLLTYQGMLDYLRDIGAYLYTGTRPASYTLGLIEAMLSGVPVVSIGRHAWGDEWGGADLFESDDIAGISFDDPAKARELLGDLLMDPVMASDLSEQQRMRAVDLFDVAKVGTQWQAFLG